MSARQTGLPPVRPARPWFSSGTCAKPPGWELAALAGAKDASKELTDVRVLEADYGTLPDLAAVAPYYNNPIEGARYLELDLRGAEPV